MFFVRLVPEPWTFASLKSDSSVKIVWTFRAPMSKILRSRNDFTFSIPKRWKIKEIISFESRASLLATSTITDWFPSFHFFFFFFFFGFSSRWNENHRGRWRLEYSSGNLPRIRHKRRWCTTPYLFSLRRSTSFWEKSGMELLAAVRLRTVPGRWIATAAASGWHRSSTATELQGSWER